ncbi:MAG: TOMM precursor leader peptide-binding protein, partial [Verrucomicrobia bacterium]|nr:TOMM precursor leader peptide-binding protein [Verrucomicrobiota bacterium]
MVFLLSEFDFVLLKGKAYSQLAPLLAEGKYSEDELIDCLTSQTPAEMLYYALERLKRQNLISQRCHHVLEDLRAFCGLLCIPENIAAEALNSTKVSITSLISPACTEFTSLLNAYQVQIVDSPEEAQIAVLIVGDYLAQGIDDFYRMRKDKPWMLLRASGAQAWVGPFFEPGKTGCYECLAKRLKQNRQEDAFFLGEETLTLPSQAKLPSARLAAWNLATTELLKRILLGKSESLEGKILIFDPLRPKLESHRIPQLFSCRDCGREKFQSAGKSLCLQSRNNKDHSGDGYRINSPEETLQQYAHLVSPVTGIVKYLERVAHPIGSAAHVYISGTNWALPNSLKFKTISSFRHHCSGKGTTDAVAKAGALCEALERFSGIYNENDIVQHAAFHDMKGSAIHPNQILLISESQYANRTAINSQAHRFASISDPFPEDKALAWSPVYSLTEKKIKHLPTALCY